MRKLTRACVIPVLIGLLLASPLRAGEADDAQLDILRDTLHANKKAFVAVNLQLSDAEAKGFWPIYDRYQSELQGVQGRLLGVIDDYSQHFGALTDEKAMDLAERYLEIERDRAEVRQRYLKPIAAVLPGKKVARFYQIENKIDAVLRYELAATIPVIE
jgi:hypothetical protein